MNEVGLIFLFLQLSMLIIFKKQAPGKEQASVLILLR
jgi:hypothetical protein